MRNKLQIIGSLITASILLFPGVASASLTLSGTAVTSDAGLTLNGATGSNVLLGSNSVSGAITIGGTLQTGNIVIGQSTDSYTISMGYGGVSSGKYKMINIGGSDSQTLSPGDTSIDIGTSYGAAGNNIIHIGGGITGGNNKQQIFIGSQNGPFTDQVWLGGTATALTITAASLSMIGGTASSSIVIGDSTNTGGIFIGRSTATNTVNIAGIATSNGNTQTVTINAGNATGTGIKVVNIATGTPATSGNNRVTIGGGTTAKATINAIFSSYQAQNYISSETGSNNAIAGALTNAGGANVTLAAGLLVYIKLGHSLQAGANTFDFNGGGAVSIKKHTNPASDISAAYVSGSIVELIYDGSAWQDMSQ